MLYFEYALFSFLEFFSIAYFGFSLFKLRMNKKIQIKLVSLSVILSIVSFVFRYFDLFQSITPFIFLVLLTLSIKPITKFGGKTSFFVGSVSYLLYGVYSTLLQYIVLSFGLIEEISAGFSHDNNFMMFWFSLSYLSIAIIMKYKTKDGFLFDPDDSEVKGGAYSNRKLITVIVLSIIISITFFALERITQKSIYFDLFLVISLILISVLMHLFYKRDKAEVDSNYYHEIEKLKKEVRIDE